VGDGVVRLNTDAASLEGLCTATGAGSHVGTAAGSYVGAVARDSAPSQWSWRLRSASWPSTPTISALLSFFFGGVAGMFALALTGPTDVLSSLATWLDYSAHVWGQPYRGVLVVRVT